MKIINPKYYAVQGENVCINANIDSVDCSVPLDPENKDYAEIMRQVDAGDLTIADAD